MRKSCHGNSGLVILLRQLQKSKWPALLFSASDVRQISCALCGDLLPTLIHFLLLISNVSNATGLSAKVKDVSGISKVKQLANEVCQLLRGMGAYVFVDRTPLSHRHNNPTSFMIT